jgi:hypothetical protein
MSRPMMRDNFSDTMLRSLVPPELRPMADHHKIMCGCTVCNTSKYLQTSLNVGPNGWMWKAVQVLYRILFAVCSFCEISNCH